MTDQWESRIVGTGDVDPEDLLANPLNARIHPRRQENALVEVLDRVGWVTEPIVNKTTGFVVDGHLRVAAAIANGQTTIPVKYVDLSEAEERLILATLDPIGGLAVHDAEMYAELVADIDVGEGVVAELVAELLGEKKEVEPAGYPDDTDESDLSWGYVRFGERTVKCDITEVDALECRYQAWREANGQDGGFVGSLAARAEPDPLFDPTPVDVS